MCWLKRGRGAKNELKGGASGGGGLDICFIFQSCCETSLNFPSNDRKRQPNIYLARLLHLSIHLSIYLSIYTFYLLFLHTYTYIIHKYPMASIYICFLFQIFLMFVYFQVCSTFTDESCIHTRNCFMLLTIIQFENTVLKLPYISF